MAVALTIAARREAIDVTLDRLGHLRGTGINHLFPEILRAAFPLQIGRRVDAGLGEQLVDQFTVSAFQGAHEGALLGPAFPDDGFFRAAIVAGTGRSFRTAGRGSALAFSQGILS